MSASRKLYGPAATPNFGRVQHRTARGVVGRQDWIGGLAWDVVEAFRGYFTVCELHMVFASLGVGEYESAIEMVLERLVRDRLELPADQTARLKTWVDLYRGGHGHAALAATLDLVTSSHDASRTASTQNPLP